MKKSFLKFIALAISVVFLSNQIQFAFANQNLSPAVSSSEMGAGLQTDILKDMESGAIGNGKSMGMLKSFETLPERLEIPEELTYQDMVNGVIPGSIERETDIVAGSIQKLVEALKLAIHMTTASLNDKDLPKERRISEQYKEDVETTLKALKETQKNLVLGKYNNLYLFTSVVKASEDYLLGFNFRGTPGLALDVINNLDLQEAAEYIFHEHVPEEDKVGHKNVYGEITKPIFWKEIEGELVNTTGQELRKHIDERASFEAETTTIPSRALRYIVSKIKFARSAFGKLLAFGTSGIRDYTKYLQDVKTNSVGKAITSFFVRMEQAPITAIGGDLRPSTRNIILMNIMAKLEMGKEVFYGGLVPTPAIMYYAMLKGWPSEEITASHCPVLPPNKEQNGDKPNLDTGEVLKEDEREILKQVREFMDIEFMKPEILSMFDEKGKLKKRSKLTQKQRNLYDSSDAIIKEVEKNEDGAHPDVMQAFIDRYSAFGEIFTKDDVIGFMEHMAVGRDVVKKIFNNLGADLQAHERHETWVEGMIVDTEDVKTPLEQAIMKINGVIKKYITGAKKHLGSFTTDGDTDRPAMFFNNVQEKGNFLYGDKLCYLPCEYIANLESVKEKKKFVAVTATVSDAVVRRLKNIGFEVETVQIGSPFVVKAMQDRIARAERDGEEVVTCGFERNGGFLLGTDLELDNGKELKALPTRDALLPIITAFKLAKEENMTVEDLVENRFSGQFVSYAWSGLIDEETVGEDNPRYTELCQLYTASMGQAIMRRFSPKNLDIIKVRWVSGGKIEYEIRGDNTTHIADEVFAGEMNEIRNTLQDYFNGDRGFNGIYEMHFLDGVRMFFNNKEVAHMRPSGNSPQWRIYSEAATEKRAREITSFSMPIYPQIIEEYLKGKKKFEGTRIEARDNDAMRETFKDVGTGEGVTKISDMHWQTWNMTFGGEGEHELTEGIVFDDKNEKVTFYSNRTYDLNSKVDIKWLPKKGYRQEKLEVERKIEWDRKKGTLTCHEWWSDDREYKEVLTGENAWLEIGRGLDKNIPMGKFQNMPFPVMSDKAKDYFMERGIRWFDLFDVSVESEFTLEAPMWAHNFNFVKKEPVPEEEIKDTLNKDQDFNIYLMIDQLRELVKQSPDEKFLLALDKEIGSDVQQGIVTLLIQAISKLQDTGELKGLEIVSAKGEDLAKKINDKIKGNQKLTMKNVIVVAKQYNVETEVFDNVKGAVIAGIDDTIPEDVKKLSTAVATNDIYIPLAETITIAVGVAMGKSFTAIKNVYDLITAEDDILTAADYNTIMKDRIIKIIPKALAFDIEELRRIYERAREALIRA